MTKFREKDIPNDYDKVICPHCSESFQLKNANFYNARYFRINRNAKPTRAPIQVVDTWNVPYSTGIFILSKDEIPEEEVKDFANKKTNFPFWGLQYLGKLWAKETWSD